MEAGYSRIPPRIGRPEMFRLWVREAVFEKRRFELLFFIFLRRILCSCFGGWTDGYSSVRTYGSSIGYVLSPLLQVSPQIPRGLMEIFFPLK